MEREELLEKLTQLDFMSVYLALYLNTHPDNKEAIAEYNRIVKAADGVRAKYEKIAGPMCSFRSVNRCDDRWQWDDCPWPWFKDFSGKEDC